MDTVKIGKFLAALRGGKNLTQEQLGEILGVTNKTVSRWENGHYLPPAEMLLELSEFYGVSVNEILRGERIQHNPAEDFQNGFSVEEMRLLFVIKWKRDHFFEIIFHLAIIAAAFFAAVCLNLPIIIIITAVISLIADIINYIRMTAYVRRMVNSSKK